MFTAACGVTAVAAGAFGAHALHATLESAGRLDAWRTAALYHLVHSVVMLCLVRRAVGDAEARLRNWTVGMFGTGIVLFSGSIYGLALGGPRWLGPVTPLGGTAFIAGWIAAGVLLWRLDRENRAVG